MTLCSTARDFEYRGKYNWQNHFHLCIIQLETGDSSTLAFKILHAKSGWILNRIFLLSNPALFSVILLLPQPDSFQPQSFIQIFIYCYLCSLGLPLLLHPLAFLIIFQIRILTGRCRAQKTEYWYEKLFPQWMHLDSVLFQG